MIQWYWAATTTSNKSTSSPPATSLRPPRRLTSPPRQHMHRQRARTIISRRRHECRQQSRRRRHRQRRHAHCHPTPPTEVPVGVPAHHVPRPSTSTSTASPAVASSVVAPLPPIPLVAAPVVDAFIARAASSVDPNKAKMIAAQRADATLAVYFAADEGQYVQSDIAANRPCLDADGLLMVRMRADTSQTVVVVPKSHIALYCTAAHGGVNGHNGKKSSLWTSQQTVWWPTQARDTAEYCDMCLQCPSQRRVLANASMGTPPSLSARANGLHADAARVRRAPTAFTCSPTSRWATRLACPRATRQPTARSPPPSVSGTHPRRSRPTWVQRVY
jgi:hypothetical protein